MTLKTLCGNLYQQAQRKEKVKGPTTQDPPAQPGDELVITLWTLASVIQAKLNPQISLPVPREHVLPIPHFTPCHGSAAHQHITALVLLTLPSPPGTDPPAFTQPGGPKQLQGCMTT